MWSIRKTWPWQSDWELAAPSQMMPRDRLHSETGGAKVCGQRGFACPDGVSFFTIGKQRPAI